MISKRFYLPPGEFRKEEVFRGQETNGVRGGVIDGQLYGVLAAAELIRASW